MTVGSPIFENLNIVGWRQFQIVDVNFHPRLTVLTGANGAGKSTLLNILSVGLGVSRPYLSVPSRRRDGVMTFLTGLFSFAKQRVTFRRDDQSTSEIGQLSLTDGQVFPLQVPSSGSASYQVSWSTQNPVLGFHVPSHRLLPTYQRLGNNFSYLGIKPEQAFDRLNNENYASYLGSHTNSSVMFQIKELLINWKFRSQDSSITEADLDQRTAYDGFVNILRKVLPAELGFEDIDIQMPDVLLKTKSGTFLIDAASGGLVTIIEIAAIIYACSIRPNVAGGRFAVTFDEPENHLHPSLQRSFLPALVDAFPLAQFIVATHSPFMVSSIKDSNVYALRYVDTNLVDAANSKEVKAKRVESLKLDYANRAGTAGEILRDVLGVPITLPSWVEDELERIVSHYQKQKLDTALIESLNGELERAGLSELFSDAVSRLGRNR